MSADPSNCPRCGYSLDLARPYEERCPSAMYPRSPRCPAAVIGCQDRQIERLEWELTTRNALLRNLQEAASARFVALERELAEAKARIEELEKSRG